MFINIATEDELSEAVAVRLISELFGVDRIGNRLGRKGNGYLRARLPNFCKMAAREPVLVLTDLDDLNCAPALLERWRGNQPLPQDLLLRVAIREVEAWLLADRDGTAGLLGLSPAKIPLNPEKIGDPKRFLLQLARGAKRDIRSELVPARGAIASQGLGYNRVLSSFVATQWDVVAASQRADSLARTIKRLTDLSNRQPD